MYLLRKLPDLKREDVEFQAFKPGGRAELDACLASVKAHYGENSIDYAKWMEWENAFAPKDDNVEAYVQQCRNITIPGDNTVSDNAKRYLIK